MSHFWINMTSRVCWFKYLQWKFESQTCNSTYSSPGDLQRHIESTHEQESMLSLVLYASSDTLMYISCKTCDMKFQTDEDMNHHLGRLHEYGETCDMYNCEESHKWGTQ